MTWHRQMLNNAPVCLPCSVYERALAYVGTDFLSHTLWDKFIDFEGSHGSPASVAALYTRVLACPIKELEKYHTG